MANASARAAGASAKAGAMRRLSRAICHGRPMAELHDLALDIVLGETGADRGAVLTFDAEQTLRFVAWRGLAAGYRAVVEGHNPWPVDGGEPEPIVVADAFADPAWAAFHDLFRAHDIGTLAFVPMWCERLQGKFMLYHREPHALDEADIEVASVLGDHLAFAAHRAHIEARMEAANQHLDGILRHVGEGITVQDLGGRILYANDVAVRITGAESRDRLLETNVSELVGGLDLRDPGGNPVSFDEMPFHQALATGQTASAVLRYQRARDARPRWTALTASAIPDAEGQPSLAVNVFRDITQQREAHEQLAENEQRLRSALESAREAEQRKDEFLAVLGHELRNPLAPIVTALRLMEMKPGSDHGRERQLIERQVAHLKRLVDDLLDISRITRGKLTLSRERVELAELVSHAVELVSPLLEERGHGLSVEVPLQGLPVLADPIRMVQVLVNLLSNAARYTEPNGHIVIVGREEADHAVLRVVDDGMGISADALPHLFELFVQGTRSVRSARGGLGLGLTIVRRLIEMHEGQVRVHSEGPGLGSEFEVRLPLRHAPAPPRPRSWPPTASPIAVRPLRVLVVDDNEDAAETLADVLSLAGHVAVTAPDGPTALEEAAAEPFDVAVLDIGLPVMDGYELARRLQQAAPATRLVAVTGYGQPHDRRQSTEAGFTQHLVKPVDLDELMLAIVGP